MPALGFAMPTSLPSPSRQWSESPASGPDAMARQGIEHGIEVALVEDQSYGLRQGRLAERSAITGWIGRPLVGEASDWARKPLAARLTNAAAAQKHRARHAVDPPALLRCAPR
jgi:hypothetical protein